MTDEKKSDDYAVDMPMLDRDSRAFEPPPAPRPAPLTSFSGSPILPIISYCGSSILMTVTNKYVLSGVDFNLNFFLLAVQV
jgi:GDP-mannose transporter